MGARRALPYLVLILLIVLSGLAAWVGAIGSTSPEAVLQRAVATTMNVSSFAFRESPTPAAASHEPFTIEDKGRYQAPSNWVLFYSSSRPQRSYSYVFLGKAEYLPGPDGRFVRFELPKSVLLTDSDFPFFEFPPLGLLLTATQVTRQGKFFRFVVPSVPFPKGWIAYAPLSGASQVPPPTIAVDLHGAATVQQGYVTSFSLFSASPGLGANWRIASFGTSAPVRPPLMYSGLP